MQSRQITLLLRADYINGQRARLGVAAGHDLALLALRCGCGCAHAMCAHATSVVVASIVARSAAAGARIRASAHLAITALVQKSDWGRVYAYGPHKGQWRVRRPRAPLISSQELVASVVRELEHAIWGVAGTEHSTYRRDASAALYTMLAVSTATRLCTTLAPLIAALRRAQREDDWAHDANTLLCERLRRDGCCRQDSLGWLYSDEQDE